MEAGSKININCPPYVIGEGSPVDIGRQIANVYQGYDELPTLAVEAWLAAAQAVGLSADLALSRAGHAVAVDLDSGVGTGIPNGYHNTKHYIEVLLNAVHLILRNDAAHHNGITLVPEERGKVLFAALTHDFHYEKRDTKDEKASSAPYHLEEISFLKAKTYLEQQGMDEKSVNEIGVMIYTTDVGSSSKAGLFLRAAHLHLFEGGPKPEQTEVLGRVREVLTNPRLARMAAILRDADILSSAGLTVDYLNRQNGKLGMELGKPRGPLDTINFLTFVVKDRFTTEAARFFQPNLEMIKQAAQDEIKRKPC